MSYPSMGSVVYNLGRTPILCMVVVLILVSSFVLEYSNTPVTGRIWAQMQHTNHREELCQGLILLINSLCSSKEHSSQKIQKNIPQVHNSQGRSCSRMRRTQMGTDGQTGKGLVRQKNKQITRRYKTGGSRTGGVKTRKTIPRMTLERHTWTQKQSDRQSARKGI